MPFELSEKTLRTGFSVRIPAKSAARGRPAHRAGPPRGDQSRHRRKSFDFFSFAYSILPYGWNLSFPPRIILERIYANRGNRHLHLHFELSLKTGVLASAGVPGSILIEVIHSPARCIDVRAWSSDRSPALPRSVCLECPLVVRGAASRGLEIFPPLQRSYCLHRGVKPGTKPEKQHRTREGLATG